jgi:hypothetical protein
MISSELFIQNSLNKRSILVLSMLSFSLKYLFDLMFFDITKNLIDDQNININISIDLLKKFSVMS